MPKRLAVTCGDPAGVGPEILQTWLQQNPEQAARITVIGPRCITERLPLDSVVSVGADGFVAEPGKPTVMGAESALDALEEAAYGCRQGRYAGVVTGPVSKSWMDQAGWSFPGQTEFFADRWHGKPSMAFAGGQLKVVLATWHIPLSEVPATMNQETLERAVRNAAWLAKRLGAAQPRIGVCGLNPHAGEGGLMGFEEQGIIDPLLEQLRAEFPGLSSTQPGDTLFWRQLQGEFDVLIALYHDQGLAPLKTLEFDQAVNITLGLPFVRTSPDHGTAFSIAGTGKASIRSFSRAYELACLLTPGFLT